MPHAHSSFPHKSQEMGTTSIHRNAINGRTLFSLEKEGLTSATAWMSLEDMMFGQRSQSSKVRYCLTPFTCGPESSHGEKHKAAARWEEGHGSWLTGTG